MKKKLKKQIGWIMIISVFAGIFIATGISESWGMALKIYGLAVFLGFIIFYASYLITES